MSAIDPGKRQRDVDAPRDTPVDAPVDAESERARASLAPLDDIVARGMRQWRETRPDIDSSAKGVIGRILRLQGVILRTVNAALAPYGLKYPAYAVLATLRVSPPPHVMTPGQLSETMLFTSGGISNLLNKVERNGWIERSMDPRDRRSVVVRLTAEGKALADRAMEAHAEAERRLIAMLAPADQALLAALLSRMLVFAPPA